MAIFGLQGAAFGTLLAVLLVEAGLILPRAFTYIGLSGAQFLRQTLIPALPGIVPMFGMAWLLDQLLGSDSLAVLILKLFVCGSLYLATFAVTAMSSEERNFIASRLQQIKSRGVPSV